MEFTYTDRPSQLSNGYGTVYKYPAWYLVDRHEYGQDALAGPFARKSDMEAVATEHGLPMPDIVDEDFDF